MKKVFKHAIPLALAIVMSLCMAAPAFASGLMPVNTAVFSGQSGSPYAVQAPEVIGRPEDQDGILLEDPVLPVSADSTYLFQMTATNVSTLLTTYDANKYFTGASMDAYADEGLMIAGLVTSSTGANGIKVGACYYDSSSDTFVSVVSSYFNSGRYESSWWSKANHFNNYMRYYGHITNNLGTGTVSGNLVYSVAVQ